MKKIVCLCLTGVLLSVSAVFGQQKDNISAEETVNYINGKLTGVAKIENAKGLLIVEFYKNGKVNRVDKVSLNALNPQNVEYMPDEKAVVIKCIAKDCIYRKITIPKTVGPYSRISFNGEYDVKSQVGLVKAFEHLIMLFYDSKYKNNTPFE